MYGNEGFLKRTLRLVFYKLANDLLIYENRARKLLIEAGFKKDNITAIYNSLDYDEHLKIRTHLQDVEIDKHIIRFFKDADNSLLIFVGRLTPVKKIDLVLKAMHLLNKENRFFNFLVIGEGSERQKLIELSEDLNLKNQVYFYGACYEETLLGAFIARAGLCVSPGNVGLTAIHALTFGTPVCTHNNWHTQMPEVEAIEDGITGCFFEEDDFNALALAIDKWFKLKLKEREAIREKCFEIVDSTYNPYNQIKIIEKLINK